MVLNKEREKFSREELQKIRKKSIELSICGGKNNEAFQKAYTQFAAVAEHLDILMAEVEDDEN